MTKEIKVRLLKDWIKQSEAFNAVNRDKKTRHELYKQSTKKAA